MKGGVCRPKTVPASLTLQVERVFQRHQKHVLRGEEVDGVLGAFLICMND